MKTEKFKYILPIIIITLLLITPQVHAKTSIEIKPSSTVYTNKTISEFFEDSIKMKEPGEGLEGSSVDVHMATNTDWAIFAYFSNSQYGTGGNGENRGINVTIGSQTYKSTNGNITGVMDFGKTVTYTAGVISNYSSLLNTDCYTYGKYIIDNATDSKHVDLINTVSAKSMAITGWYKAEYYYGDATGMPFSTRKGLFGFVGGKTNSYQIQPNGYPWDYTFRPVIWN